MEPRSWSVLRELPAGTRPNGVAWDPWRGWLLVADVEGNRARIIDPRDAREVATTALPGRPRWCLHQSGVDRYLVNIAEPALLVELSGADGCLLHATRISPAGPHGLDVDPVRQRAFVACDAGKLAVVNLMDGSEIHEVEIAGPPDVVWFNPDGRRLYVAIGNPGVIQVIDVQRLGVVEEVTSEAGAHTTAFDRAVSVCTCSFRSDAQ
jgi:DNA-binding beta-propeller fold protein YncE